MFKVITWNVNSVNARLERVLGVLKRHQPDVLSLQELKCVEDKFPLQSIKDLGYECAIFGQKTYNGVAIISKHPIKLIHKGFQDGVEDDAARFITARIKNISLMSAYIPNGQEVGSEKYNYKLKWLKRLRTYLDTHFSDEKDLLLMGDFNVAPEEMDVHDPEKWIGKVLFSKKEKLALKEIIEFGLVDLFRQKHPEPGYYTWWDYRAGAFPRNNGLRIDFIFATKQISQKCTSCHIDREERKGEKPSDHAPVVAELEI